MEPANGVALATVFFWPKKIGQWIPSPLAALLIGTTLGALVGIPSHLVLGDIPQAGFPPMVDLSISQSTLPIILESAVILALLGAIDSLLTSLVADNMTQTRHKSGQELVGQGIGNTVAGLFGAIPGAGATMRTAARTP